MDSPGSQRPRPPPASARLAWRPELRSPSPDPSLAARIPCPCRAPDVTMTTPLYITRCPPCSQWALTFRCQSALESERHRGRAMKTERERGRERSLKAALARRKRRSPKKGWGSFWGEPRPRVTPDGGVFPRTTTKTLHRGRSQRTDGRGRSEGG